jgi:SAM-dependent methyltransferase
MAQEKDYVLGTHDEEIDRLGLQNRVWRPRVLDAWRRAGFTAGQTILDVGCGPGYASMDLAEIVGPEGKVIAIDRSRRFLDALERRRGELGLENITSVEQDLDEGALPDMKADGAWSRWIFAFVKHPRELLTRVCSRIRPGGTIVMHEYFDYSTWRLAPRSPELEEFVDLVMQSWRASGGEPDIGLSLPAWLEETGFKLKELRPIIEVAPRSNYVWEWPKAFIDVGLARLVELGSITSARARSISEAWRRSEAAPYTLVITPGVLEIIARRPL